MDNSYIRFTWVSGILIKNVFHQWTMMTEIWLWWYEMDYSRLLMTTVDFKKKIFFVPGHDRVVTTKPRNFSVAKVWCCMVYIDLPGVVIWQHIHPSTLHSYWEEGWQDSSCLRAILRPENNSVQEFFWYTGMRPGRVTHSREHHTHCSQSFVSPDWIPPGTYSWQP